MQDTFLSSFSCGVDKCESQDRNGNFSGSLFFRGFYWHESGDSLSRARPDVLFGKRRINVVCFHSGQRENINKEVERVRLSGFVFYGILICFSMF